MRDLCGAVELVPTNTMSQLLYSSVYLAVAVVLSRTMPVTGKASARCPGWCNNQVNKKKGWKTTIANQTTPKCQWQQCQECPQWKRQCAKCPGWCNNKKNTPKGWLDTIEGQTTPKCYWKKCFECPEWLNECRVSTSCGFLHVANSDQEGTIIGSTGDTVLVACANGFVGGSAQVACTALGDGTSAHSAWTGAPTCSAASCGTLVVDHSNQLGTTNGITGDTALVICNDGDYATAECKGTSTGVSAWSNTPVCQGCSGVECFFETSVAGYWDCNSLLSAADLNDCAQHCLAADGGCGGFWWSDATCRVMSKPPGQLETECRWDRDTSGAYYKSRAQGPVGDETKFHPQVFAEGMYCDHVQPAQSSNTLSSHRASETACHDECKDEPQCNYFSVAPVQSHMQRRRWCMTHASCTVAISGGYEGPAGSNPYNVYQPARDDDTDDYDEQGDDVSKPRLLQDSGETPSRMPDEGHVVDPMVI